jgi:hypothetical protein
MLHRFGQFELDERRFELRCNGRPLALQRQVLETIAYLVKNPDRCRELSTNQPKRHHLPVFGSATARAGAGRRGW